MSEPIRADAKDDVLAVKERRVACDGPADGRHPRVYLTMVDDAAGNPTQVVCPYCSKVFVYAT